MSPLLHRNQRSTDLPSFHLPSDMRPPSNDHPDYERQCFNRHVKALTCSFYNVSSQEIRVKLCAELYSFIFSVFDWFRDVFMGTPYTPSATRFMKVVYEKTGKLTKELEHVAPRVIRERHLHAPSDALEEHCIRAHDVITAVRYKLSVTFEDLLCNQE